MYMQNKDYKKAEEQYKELYKANTDLYYFPYVKCLHELNDFKLAEKILRKQIKKYNNDPSIRLELMNHFIKANENEKAKKEMGKIITDCPNQPEQILGLLQLLKEKNYINEAIELLNSKKKTEVIELVNFDLELADLYQKKGDNLAAINSYIDLIDKQPENIELIKNALQTLINQDESADIKQRLKSSLIKRSNEFPNNGIYNDFIIWYFIQEKDFEQALNQSKAIDKKNNEEGNRIVYLAPICIKNNDYLTAVKCYQYLISKGSETYYYKYALQELTHTQFLQTTRQPNYTPKDINESIVKIESTLSQLGKNQTTFILIEDLAKLYLNYADSAQKAIELTNEVLNNIKLTAQQEASLKLIQADAYIVIGEMYEPALLYGQVSKQFKEDAIGAEAKYRNAKLSFFKNDFEWSQAQLDVLKASTSKLIANDALYFSLLIQDNTIDSNFIPLSLFAKAELLIFQRKYVQAFQTFDSITIQFPGHSLNDDILYSKGNISLQQQRTDDAIGYYTEITKSYYNDILADDALFKLAQIFQYRLNDTTKASALYEEIITKNASSIYAVEARKQYRLLRGDKLN